MQIISIELVSRRKINKTEYGRNRYRNMTENGKSS